MENWEENIKKALGKVARVQPGDELFQKVERQLGKPGGIVASMKVYKAAAAAVVVLLLNTAVLSGTSRQSRQETTPQATYSVVSDYNIYGHE